MPTNSNGTVRPQRLMSSKEPYSSVLGLSKSVPTVKAIWMETIVNGNGV